MHFSVSNRSLIVVTRYRQRDEAPTFHNTGRSLIFIHLLLARVMGQYFLLAGVCRRLSSVVVCNTAGRQAGGRAGRRARERSGSRHSTAGQ